MNRINAFQSAPSDTRFRREGLALLGNVPEPQPESEPKSGLTIDEALGAFWTISIDHIRGKTEIRFDDGRTPASRQSRT